jgi:hypothetical protein
VIANSKLASKALILATGPDNPAADQIVSAALRDFVCEEIELQRIDLGGRTILALLIAHDPAHGEAIRSDLEQVGAKNSLDIAMLEIEE